MSKYTDAVAHNLKGCEATSTGPCPGCDECRALFDKYKVRETTEEESGVLERWTFDANTREPEGNFLDPNDPRKSIYFETKEAAEAASRAQFEEDWRSLGLSIDASFSHSECGICGSTLGGDREVWHYVAKNSKGVDTIYHHDDACVDCVMYLANGDEPEDWGDDDEDDTDEPEPDEPEKPTNSLDTGTLDEFTRAYLETALWSSNDESTPQGGEPFDKNYTLANIHPDDVAEAIKLCADFQAAHSEDLDTCTQSGPDWGPMGHGGHDLWLTRNGHGAGFWDGDYPKEPGERLTKAAKELGECYPYLSDDGWVRL